ncbi:MAG: hypothetical protein R3F14_46750 [Polyangiaceae bacterium]
MPAPRPRPTRNRGSPASASLPVSVASGRCRGIYECAYDSTADETFQIGPVPPIAGLWFAGGLSGHGFKHAPSLGESLAASVVNGQPEPDLAPYTLRIPRS